MTRSGVIGSEIRTIRRLRQHNRVAHINAGIGPAVGCAAGAEQTGKFTVSCGKRGITLQIEKRLLTDAAVIGSVFIRIPKRVSLVVPGTYVG